MEQIKILQFLVDYDKALSENKEFVANQAQLKVGIVAIREENKKLNKELRELNKARLTGDNSAIERSKAVAAQLAKNEKALKELGGQVKETNKEFEKAKFAEGSIKALQAELSELTKEYDLLSESAREGLGGQEQLAKIQALSDKLKELEGATGRNQRNVGDYKSVLEGLSADSLNGILGVLQDSNPAFANAIGGGKEFSGILTVISKNPFVGILSLAAAVLTTLGAAFFKSEKGARVLAKGAAFLEGVTSALVKVATDAVEYLGLFNEETEKGEENTSAFSLIIENLTNRLVGFLSLIEKGGLAIDQALTGNFKAARESAKLAGLAIAQVTTGFDFNAQSKVAEVFKDTAIEIENNTNAFVNLEKAQFAARQEARGLEIAIADLTTQQEIQGAIADDTTKSLSEQNEARVKELDFAVAASAKKVELASTELGLLQSEIAIRKSNNEDIQDLLDQETQALISVKDAERELLLETLNNSRERNQIRQDEVELQLDIIRDGFENYRQANLDFIQNDKESIDERIAAQRLIQVEAEKAFEKQKEILQAETDVRIDFNNLINNANAEKVQEEIDSLQLSELISKQLFDTIKDRRLLVQDLAAAQELLNIATENQKVIDVETNASEALTELFSSTIKTEQQIAEESKDIQQAAQSEILKLKINSALSSKDEIIKAESELAQLEFEIREQARQRELQAVTDVINIEKNERIAAVIGSVSNAEKRAEQIAVIEADSAKKIIEEKLRLENLSAAERSDLELQLINNIENATIASTQRTAENIKEIVSSASTALQTLLNATSQFQAAATQRQLNALDEQEERRLESAGNNADERLRIEEEFAERREQIEREAFERQKKFARAQAVINGALAVTKILAETPKFDFGVATALQIAGAVVTTAAQVATINAQEFKQGGILQGIKHGQDGKRGVAMIDRNGGSLMAYAERDEAVLTSASTNAGKNLGLTSFLNEKIFGGDKLGTGGTPPPPHIQKTLQDWINGKSRRTTATFREVRNIDYGRIRSVQNGTDSIDYDRIIKGIAGAVAQLPSQTLHISAMNRAIEKNKKSIKFKHG